MTTKKLLDPATRLHDLLVGIHKASPNSKTLHVLLCEKLGLDINKENEAVEAVTVLLTMIKNFEDLSSVNEHMKELIEPIVVDLRKVVSFNSLPSSCGNLVHSLDRNHLTGRLKTAIPMIKMLELQDEVVDPKIIREVADRIKEAIDLALTVDDFKLRNTLLKHLQDIERALKFYEFTGSSYLEDRVNRFLGEVQTKQSIWSKLKKYVPLAEKLLDVTKKLKDTKLFENFEINLYLGNNIVDNRNVESNQ